MSYQKSLKLNKCRGELKEGIRQMFQYMVGKVVRDLFKTLKVDLNNITDNFYLFILKNINASGSG